MNSNLSMEKYDNNTRMSCHVCERNFMLPARVSPQIHHLTLLSVLRLSVLPVLPHLPHPYPVYSPPRVPDPTTIHIMLVTETETVIENARKTANVLIANVSGKSGIVSVSNATALLKLETQSVSRQSA
jgi:hypothetical protein